MAASVCRSIRRAACLMRVVVVGASGNVGTSLLRALAAEQQVQSVLGLARRMPEQPPGEADWAAADIGTDDLTEHFAGADAVVHLAWLFQPTRDPITTWRTNVLGSLRVFRAVADADVPVLVYASSVGAYSPSPSDGHPVDESWPTHSWPTANYGREKAYVERLLDHFELQHPSRRVVRMRPGFIFKEEAATEQRRLFAGPFVPNRLIRPELLPLVPHVPGLRFQALHADDAAEAYRLALLRPVRGPFNIAADPVLDTARLAELLDARTILTPGGLIRAAVAAAWHLRLTPAPPQLFDLLRHLPIMDTSRAHTELGWTPRHSALDAVRAFLTGFQAGSGGPTPPLDRRTSGRFRANEFGSGVGKKP
jgi:UDP-glucose 4-epimerase